MNYVAHGTWTAHQREKLRKEPPTEKHLGFEFLKLKNCFKIKEVEIPQFENLRHNVTNMHNPATAEKGRVKNWGVYGSFMLSKPAVLLSWFTNTEMLTHYSELQNPLLFNCKKCGTLSTSACIK